MDCTTPQGFLKRHKVTIWNMTEPLVKEIERGLEHPFRTLQNKIVIALPGHHNTPQSVFDAVRDRYLKAGWLKVEFNNDTNASYSGYTEAYLFLPENLTVT